jgi:CPA1 family monovalent cation:H+ antiporter
MQTANIHDLEILLLFLLALVVALAALARRFRTPYPIVLVMGGLAVSVLPGIPTVTLNPDVVFLVLLPPLIFATAFHTSWQNLRAHLATILMMAFGLVSFTVASIALVTGWMLPGFDHRIGFVLGALVASTDAIAASAIAKRMRLPRRIADVLEGESLVNDASSLVALEFSVSILMDRHLPSVGEGTLRMMYLALAGVGIGLVAGAIIWWCQTKLAEAATVITAMLLAPYIAYLAAESIHASGILATAACGLYLGRKQRERLPERVRIDSSAVWSTLDFILNGIVFILIGLQFPHVIAGIRNLRPMDLVIDVALLSGLLIMLRLFWVFAASWLHYWFRRLAGREYSPPRINEIFIIGWTGMRGVIGLAAAMSLPDLLKDGTPFPQRSVLVFLSFCVILVTLVAQGLSLPMVIRKLRLAADDAASDASRAA